MKRTLTTTKRIHNHILRNKRILIAVTGSIAAYKAVLLVRLCKKAGWDVKVIMTPSAADFVSPLTFSVLSGHPVDIDISEGGSWNNHVEHGLWADLMVVAPCTANTLAGMAYGFGNNALLATYLSARCPIMISPAMDVDMYHHPATQSNLKTLNDRGHLIVPVEYGELASGLIGEGRMAEPEVIMQYIKEYFEQNAVSKALHGKKILITAGPTYEAIDPVRFIGNRSSGKMGIALADECTEQGGEVHLVLGPSAHEPVEDVTVYRVESAEDMLNEAKNLFGKCDVGIMAAAVADYRPSHAFDQKWKKEKGSPLHIELEETVDIAMTLGREKKPHQILIGFALETDEGKEAAKNKIKKKNFDFIALNSLKDDGAGFGYDTNKITVIHEDGSENKYQLKSKSEVAKDIVNEIIQLKR